MKNIGRASAVEGVRCLHLTEIRLLRQFFLWVSVCVCVCVCACCTRACVGWNQPVRFCVNEGNEHACAGAVMTDHRPASEPRGNVIAIEGVRCLQLTEIGQLRQFILWVSVRVCVLCCHSHGLEAACSVLRQRRH